jgi:hypothetical protein
MLRIDATIQALRIVDGRRQTQHNSIHIQPVVDFHWDRDASRGMMAAGSTVHGESRLMADDVSGERDGVWT